LAGRLGFISHDGNFQHSVFASAVAAFVDTNALSDSSYQILVVMYTGSTTNHISSANESYVETCASMAGKSPSIIMF